MFLDRPPSDQKHMGRNDVFRFSCHKALGCFNTCCANKHLPLTPYDVLRLKRVLNKHSDAFLSDDVVFRVDPKSGFPIISIRMGEDEAKTCPFVSQNGCKVYPHRPTACRIYPLARVSRHIHGGREKEEIFYFLETGGCLGVGEQRNLTVREWVDEQGLSPYLEKNDQMLDILFHPKRDPKQPLTERQLQKVIVACYNLDVFRDFVFKTDFLERYPLDPDTRKVIEENDEALLDVALAYLKRTLYT